jgi:hypothetical protein
MADGFSANEKAPTGAGAPIWVAGLARSLLAAGGYPTARRLDAATWAQFEKDIAQICPILDLLSDSSCQKKRFFQGLQ